jgi:flagellar assembly protein FliH
VDPEALLGLVKAAFEGIALSEVTEVRAAPTMEPLLRRYLEAIGAPQAIRVACDASLGAGGLEVDTLRGTLDASVDTQLDEIGRGLADLMPPARVRS